MLDRKKKEKTAVAVAYTPGERAPKILATGKGEVAERIIETAKENEVPLYEDDKLASTLSRLDIGDMIPPELYDVVAQILVFVDDMDRLRGKVEAIKKYHEYEKNRRRIRRTGGAVFKERRISDPRTEL